MKTDQFADLGPVIALAAARLQREPEWAVPLLRIACDRLVLAVLRDRRDFPVSPPDAIEAAEETVWRGGAELGDVLAAAHLCARHDRLEKALGWCRLALELAAEDGQIHRLEASLLERTGRLDEALEAIARARFLLPGNGEVASDFARIDTAYVNLLNARAVEADSDHPPTFAGNLDQSLAVVDRVISREPSVAGHHRLRARLLEETSRLGEALEAASKAAALDPADPSLQRERRRLWRGVLARRLGLAGPRKARR